MRWYGRLRRSGEIGAVRRRGRRFAFESFALYALASDRGTSVCVTVSKAVGGAVVRNAVRRRIRGALDALQVAAPAARLLFVARPVAAGLGYARLAADVEAAVERARTVA